MINEEKIHKSTSGWWALSPLFVFLCLYLVTSILVNDFYKVPITVAFLISSCYAIAITRGLNLEQRVYAEQQTQLFIETPYRNNKMVEDILSNCRPQTKLCIAANITCEGEYIKTKTVKEWQGKVPDLSKIPCIFLLYK